MHQQNFSQILDKTRKEKKKFSDPEFKPNKDNLCADQQIYKSHYFRFSWKRISEIYKGSKPVIFDRLIEPSDIKQGEIGNCYFLSTLSVLAENPKRIQKLFLSDKVNDQGVYGVTMTKSGVRIQVVLDDYIPVINDKPAFSKSHGPELWVIILEKAWAKIHGNYERIEAGESHKTMRDLTGAPAYEYFVDTEPDMFAKILAADKKNYIITSGCNADNDAEVQHLKSKGLVGEHSYGIIAAKRIKDKQGNTVDLCQLRNPWGAFEWSGRWGDKSDCWTPELRKELDVKDADDGLFWMDFEDLNDFFPRVQICKYRDDFKYSFIENKGSYGAFVFNVPEDGMHTFSISQLSARQCPRNMKYFYSDARLFIIKIEDQFDPKNSKQIKYIEGCKGFHDRDLYLEIDHLERGTYIAFTEIDWCEESNLAKETYTFTCYGQNAIEFRNKTKFYPREVLVKSTMMAMLRDKQVQAQTQGLPGNEAPGIQITELKTEFAYALYMIENKEKELAYIETADFLKFLKVELLPPEQGNTYKVKVEAGDTRAIALKFGVNGYSISKSYSYIMVKQEGTLYKECLGKGQKQERAPGIVHYLLQHQGGILMVYKNDSKDKVLNETITFTLEGLVIVGNKPNDNVVQFSLAPKGEKVVELHTMTGGFSFGMGTSYSIGTA